MLTKYFGNQDKTEGMGLPPRESKDFQLLAAHACDLALQRGFYFSFRLPDWARDFKEHTREIIASPFHETSTTSNESKLSRQKSKYFHGDLRPDRYGMISENMGTSFFNEMPHDMQSKSGRPVRSPKIKDDVTCKKRG
ncbi:uncharacterized protein [Drosophila bipectinata]|uniref:uncharacterized protein n=1 Tax=Drosophila bipectinata TaxID=42026 RepID=UPI001C8AE9FB|nr:uncharacterized protein LOC108133048 [Drosophila bipectinata]